MVSVCKYNFKLNMRNFLPCFSHSTRIFIKFLRSTDLNSRGSSIDNSVSKCVNSKLNIEFEQKSILHVIIDMNCCENVTEVAVAKHPLTGD